MDKVKVLVIGPSPSKSKGGMATVINEIEHDKKLRDNFDIEIFDSYIDGRKIKVLFYSIFSFIKFCLTKNKFDIYHIHVASKGSTFRKSYYVRKAIKWNKKVIVHIHGARYMEFYNKLSQNKKIKVTNMLKSVDMVIALSEDWKKKFDSTLGLKNCVVLENGIDTEGLNPAITDPKKFQKSFVMLGRLGERKGTYDLVNAIEMAIKLVPDIKCYLAGDGEVDKFKKIVSDRRLEKNIKVIGWADFEKKLELLSKVSTLVLPSYNEGLPMAVLEGMACGKVIISTTVGAIPEVINSENGILVKPGDTNSLCDAIVECCTNLDMINSISKNNIQKVSDIFSMNVMHERLMMDVRERSI